MPCGHAPSPRKEAQFCWGEHSDLLRMRIPELAKFSMCPWGRASVSTFVTSTFGWLRLILAAAHESPPPTANFATSGTGSTSRVHTRGYSCPERWLYAGRTAGHLDNWRPALAAPAIKSGLTYKTDVPDPSWAGSWRGRNAPSRLLDRATIPIHRPGTGRLSEALGNNASTRNAFSGFRSRQRLPSRAS